MNAAEIDRLVAALPADLDERHRRRINGYAATARRCDERITMRRHDLERVLRYVDDAAAGDGAVEAPDEAIRVAIELDALERVQPQIDSWLRVAVSAVAEAPGPAPFGEGPA